MGDHLTADISRIREVSGRLTGLAGEFSQATTLAGSYAGCLGSLPLAGAFEDFASNWKIHRERLIGQLERAATLSKAAADGYQGTDEQLAAVLRGQGLGTIPGAPAYPGLR